MWVVNGPGLGLPHRTNANARNAFRPNPANKSPGPRPATNRSLSVPARDVGYRYSVCMTPDVILPSLWLSHRRAGGERWEKEKNRIMVRCLSSTLGIEPGDYELRPRLLSLLTDGLFVCPARPSLLHRCNPLPWPVACHPVFFRQRPHSARQAAQSGSSHCRVSRLSGKHPRATTLTCHGRGASVNCVVRYSVLGRHQHHHHHEGEGKRPKTQRKIFSRPRRGIQPCLIWPRTRLTNTFPSVVFGGSSQQ